MNNAGVVHELSNVCSQLFDLQYKHLQTLKKNKIPQTESNIFQLNQFGVSFLKHTQTMLKDFFPTHERLVSEAITSSIENENQDCFAENHIF